MNEREFIESLRALARDPAARGLVDDVAVLTLGDRCLVLTQDMIVEGVHYLPGDPPEDVAWKLVAVNLSDLAAKGAEPVGVLLGFASLAFGVPIRGSIASLLVICLVSALSFGALGLLLASRARTVEGVSGLMNLVMLPMWIFSGVFFSASRFPDALQPFIQALPLTAVIDALRASMLEGAGWSRLAPELAIVAVWLVASFALAVRLFRWR